MSQNSHKNLEFNTKRRTRYFASFEQAFYSVLLFCFASLLVLAPNSAQAAVSSTTKVRKNQTYVLKSNLDKMATKDSAILDWRTQEFELTFDLPANDWYENLDLFLSAYPEGRVARGTPLLISYNGTKPVPIYGRASRFDAHIRMDTSRIRLSGNSIKISYQTPRNADCLTPDNGQWILDLARSKLVAKARTKNRDMQVIEIEQRMAHAMTAPKRVSITAKGNNKLAYEALAAQGIAQRMTFVPEFKLNAGLSDMEFIIGTHDDIRPLLSKKSMLKASGARVVLDDRQKPTVILTAETEEQVLELTRAFATYHLPTARRSSIAMNELYASPQFAHGKILEAKEYKLSDIGSPVISPSWRPEPASIKFNVADPLTTSGKLTLNILSSKDINSDSRLSVKLNDQSIGFTHLDKTSKLVSFAIKPGMFSAAKNTLSFVPEILADPSAPICQSQQNTPSILVNNTSKLSLTKSRLSFGTDLNRLAASGAPFDADSTLVLTARSTQDKLSTLQLLGYAAQQFGPRWSSANYVSALPAQEDLDQNILIIGPNPITDTALYSAAPSALKHALGKRVLNTPNNARSNKFASNDAAQTFSIAARQDQDRGARLQSGGLAALFPSPFANGRMIGVIGSDRPEIFANSVNFVTSNKYWNSLQGSVARWDKNTILMAQMATPLPASFGPQETISTNDASNFITTAKTWFASLSMGKPKEALPSLPTELSGTPDAKPTQTELQTTALEKQPWNLPEINFSVPSMTEIKLKGQQTSRDLKSWWGKASVQAFESKLVKQWWSDITHNRAAFFLLIVFLGFFIAALGSPMMSRKK